MEKLSEAATLKYPAIPPQVGLVFSFLVMPLKIFLASEFDPVYAPLAAFTRCV